MLSAMPQLLYIHGFLSSPQSYKAQQMQHYVAQHHPEIVYHCPQLSPYPKACAEVLEAVVAQVQADSDCLYIMGSSMGGFWASHLVERYNLPAVLINPAVDALNLMPRYLNQSLKNYHNDEVYYLKADDLAQLSRYDTPTIARHKNYWLFAQTGDETLDYRLSEVKYQHCRQTIEPGGDHSFQHFERFHAQVMDFFATFEV